VDVTLTVAIRALAIAGFPLVAISASVLGVTPRAVTVPYRAVVVVLSAYFLLRLLLRRRDTAWDGLLVTFFTLYLGRLLYDWQFVGLGTAETYLQYFLALVVLPTLASSSARTGVREDQHLAASVLVLSVATCLLAIVASRAGLAFNPWEAEGGETTRLGFEALNPISLGNVGAVCAFAGLTILSNARFSYFFRFLGTLACVLGPYILLMSNSRGPILAALAMLAWFYRSRPRRRNLWVPLVVAVIGLAYFSDEIWSNVSERFAVDLRLDQSTAERVVSQVAAWEGFLANPVLGAFHLDPQLGVGFYPHNFYIETLMALGLCGAIVAVSLTVRALMSVSRSDAAAPFATLVLVQQFVMFQLSGAIATAEAFFLTLAIVLASRSRREQQRILIDSLPPSGHR
jgi:hypothetical protein